MIPAIVGTTLAKPLVKYGLLAAAALLLVGGTHWYVQSERAAAKKAGQNEVIVKTQENTVREQERSRAETEKRSEEIRNTPWQDRVDRLP